MDGGLLAAVLLGLGAGFALSFALGLAVGFFSGLLGIGGGTMLVPIFKLGFAMDAIASTATSLFTIIPTSLAGFASHLRRGTCVPKIGLAAGCTGAVFSPAGVWLATRSEEWMIMCAAALVIGYSAFTMLRKALGAPAGAQGLSGGEGLEVPRFEVARADLAKAACIGVAAGAVSGYVGVGGGFIMVPLFLRYLALPMKLASGTSLIAVMVLALPGVVYQAYLGNVDWLAGVAVALGSVPGAALGARFVPRVPERALRLAFACFLLFAALMLLVDQFA